MCFLKITLWDCIESNFCDLKVQLVSKICSYLASRYSIPWIDYYFKESFDFWINVALAFHQRNFNYNWWSLKLIPTTGQSYYNKCPWGIQLDTSTVQWWEAWHSSSSKFSEGREYTGCFSGFAFLVMPVRTHNSLRNQQTLESLGRIK